MSKALQNIIDFFISIPNTEDDVSVQISPLKLQKLLYYAQGFSLALLNQELFTEDFYAWRLGPVIPRVYQKYKQYGNGAIPKIDLESFDNYSPKVKKLLDDVYDAFGPYSAPMLSAMSHNTTPWKDTEQDKIISKEKMKQYFLTQIEK